MIKKLLKFILSKIFWGAGRHFLSDKQYAKTRYWLELDRPLNLENPEGFTEKIQYIKLYERTGLRKRVADRMKVRNYVAGKIGDEYLVPLAGVYENLTPDIWQELPSQFVLKANHGCGMLQIVRDKEQAGFETVRQQTERWKHTDYYTFSREWVYKNLPRTILAEELLLRPDNTIPEDYKFFCFGGRVEVIQVDTGRFENQKRNLYDRDFKKLNAELLYPNHPGKSEKPPLLDEAIEVAETLSADFNFIRVDLYIMENHIYFGELTNYPGNGFIEFKPESMEQRMGSLLKL